MEWSGMESREQYRHTTELDHCTLLVRPPDRLLYRYSSRRPWPLLYLAVYTHDIAEASFQLFLGGAKFFVIFQCHRTTEKFEKQHFICSNFTLFIVPFFSFFFFLLFSLISFLSFFFFFFSFSLGGGGGDGPPVPLKWRPCDIDLILVSISTFLKSWILQNLEYIPLTVDPLVRASEGYILKLTDSFVNLVSCILQHVHAGSIGDRDLVDKSDWRHSRPWHFFKHNFCVKPCICSLCTREPRRDPSNRRLNEHGIYISDTARNRTHNLFRPKREPIPLGHSDIICAHILQCWYFVTACMFILYFLSWFLLMVTSRNRKLLLCWIVFSWVYMYIKRIIASLNVVCIQVELASFSRNIFALFSML